MFLKLCWVAFPKMPGGRPEMGNLGSCLYLEESSFNLISFLVDFIRGGVRVPKITEKSLKSTHIHQSTDPGQALSHDANMKAILRVSRIVKHTRFD